MDLVKKSYLEERLSGMSTIGAASLTKIAVPTAASTMAHTGVADSVPYWKADA